MNTEELDRLFELLNLGIVSRRWSSDIFEFFEHTDEERIMEVKIEEMEN